MLWHAAAAKQSRAHAIRFCPDKGHPPRSPRQPQPVLGSGTLYRCSGTLLPPRLWVRSVSLGQHTRVHKSSVRHTDLCLCSAHNAALPPHQARPQPHHGPSGNYLVVTPNPFVQLWLGFLASRKEKLPPRLLRTHLIVSSQACSYLTPCVSSKSLLIRAHHCQSLTDTQTDTQTHTQRVAWQPKKLLSFMNSFGKVKVSVLCTKQTTISHFKNFAVKNKFKYELE